MNRVLLIFSNDLRRRLKSPLSILLMMAIPLVMTLVIGGVFGRSGKVEMTKIRLLVFDADRGIGGRFVKQGFEQGKLAEMFELTPVDSVEGAGLMAEGKASALLIIPRGFTNDLLDRKQTALELIKNPSESFKPIIAEEAALTIAAILDNGTSVFREPLEKTRSMLKADKWPSLGDMQGLLDEAKVPFTQVEGYIGDSLVTLGSETAADTARAGGGAGSSGFNIFSYVMSGSLMLGLLFTSNIMLNDIVREKSAGTLARALCAPIGTGQVVAGKVLSVYAVTAIACLLLLAVGRFAFSMDLGDPAALAAHTAASILMCTGIMTLLFGIVRRERAADAIAPVVIIVLAMLGGSMLSFDMFGETMQRIGRFSPVYWANDGFKKIMVFGAGTADILGNILLLAAIGLASLVPGALLLGAGFRKGG